MHPRFQVGTLPAQVNALVSDAVTLKLAELPAFMDRFCGEKVMEVGAAVLAWMCTFGLGVLVEPVSEKITTMSCGRNAEPGSP